MSKESEATAKGVVSVHGIDLEVVRQGAGSPILLLHGFQPLDPAARFCGLLGRHARIVAPSHPGFGGSPRPDGFESMYDLVNLYCAMLDALPDERTIVMGFSFGGWLAAELAVRSRRKIERLILVDPVGIKVRDRETPDILDVFNTHPHEVKQRAWHDPANAPEYDEMTDAQLVTMHRNWESLALFAWHPYMHNPRLAYWLPSIATPTLVLWGASDRIVSPAYGQAFAGLIPGARFAAIERAGHHPHLEQPDAVVDHVVGFLNR